MAADESDFVKEKYYATRIKFKLYALFFSLQLVRKVLKITAQIGNVVEYSAFTPVALVQTYTTASVF